MPACSLVRSEINHTRHGTPSHFLARRGLSIYIDLDDLAAADRQSFLFSIDRWNLLSLHVVDYGPNFEKKSKLQDLAAYARQMAANLIPSTDIGSVHLLTFPRIFGLAFNPVSVYVLRDKAGADCLYIYEVRNTFGDMHSYVGRVHSAGTTLTATKIFHVSPFFPIEGEYSLKVRAGVDKNVRILMRYVMNGKPQLTATLRGTCETLTNISVVKNLIATRQWPMRPLLSIHVEAAKLWFKKAPFFKRPKPPQQWSKAKELRKN